MLLHQPLSRAPKACSETVNGLYLITWLACSDDKRKNEGENNAWISYLISVISYKSKEGQLYSTQFAFCGPLYEVTKKKAVHCHHVAKWTFIFHMRTIEKCIITSLLEIYITLPLPGNKKKNLHVFHDCRKQANDY